MVCSTCFSVTTTTTIFASSLPNNNNNKNNSNTNRSVVPASLVPPPLPTQNYKNKPGVRRIKNAQQPSVAEILTNPFGQDEGPVEKKLRETGEWIIDTTEGATRSAGQEILMVLCLRVLPLWVLFLLVASGFVKLPFDLPFLDDLIM
ncbi:hypothetical protein BVC80_9071g11 [Macleaya cordata]|uniref:Chlororespiratory reduction 3 n=1 Tax=Macleaya cordata TaxID=56857 RepID=A0A200PU32_MACCD|nr:hypothetical protein BVC80_9071g11 [Macleaya cordata]